MQDAESRGAAASSSRGTASSARAGIAYPFSAIVGQNGLRRALLLLAVDPSLGGVLIQGEKGTAKTTAVRALAALLPDASGRTGAEGNAGGGVREPGAGTVPDDPRGAFVELPLSATEDRVVGSIDVHSLVADGAASLRPGLVSAADGGVLYVDEVNLLADNLVDVLLDAAATGRVTVERDGISASATSRFALVGTMNPEEGELRPQLLDRFGLSVEVSAPTDPAERVEVVTRRLAFESDPGVFVDGFARAERSTAAAIAAARDSLDGATLPLRELRRIALVCLEVGVQGLRADVVCARAAKANAVLEGRSEVTEADVRAVASFVLPHRRRRDPFDESGMSESEIDEAFEAARRALDALEDEERSTDGAEKGEGPDADEGRSEGPGDDDPDDGPEGPGDDPEGGARPPDDGGPRPPTPPGSGDADRWSREDPGEGPDTRSAGDERAAPETGGDGTDSAEAELAADGPVARALRGVDLHSGAPARPTVFRLSGTGFGARGRRSTAVTASGRSLPAPAGARGARLDLVPTVRAAAGRWAEERARVTARNACAGETTGPGPVDRTVGEGDLRFARRLGRSGDLVAFCVDTSGSMAARRRLELVARSAVAVLRDAYVRRDLVGVVTAGGGGAALVLPPTRSVDRAVATLGEVRTGGRTPLAEGLAETRRMLAVHRLRDPDRRAIVLVLTDGRATAGRGARGRALEEARRLGRTPGVAPVVIDCEAGRVRLGTAAELARAMGAPLVPLDGLTHGGVAELVRAR